MGALGSYAAVKWAAKTGFKGFAAKFGLVASGPIAVTVTLGSVAKWSWENAVDAKTRRMELEGEIAANRMKRKQVANLKNRIKLLTQELNHLPKSGKINRCIYE